MRSIAALLTWSDRPDMHTALEALRAQPGVNPIAVVGVGDLSASTDGLPTFLAERLWSSAVVTEILAWFDATGAEMLLWLLPGAPELLPRATIRLDRASADAGAALAYGDGQVQQADGSLHPHPHLDYQLGSLRDDFDFGAALLIDGAHLRRAATSQREDGPTLEHGALYDLRLRLAERGTLLHLPEPIYTQRTGEARDSGDQVFDYVDPRRRDYQIEMEQVATAYLERIGAKLAPASADPVPDDRSYPIQASVVIPVRDRVNTVDQAVESALSQRPPFEYNVIVVDNHSTDGTTALLAERAAEEPRLIHLVPESTGLGIGGCWNEAINSDHCGRYAVQLDSDDLYSGEDVLTRLIATLEGERCAMVIGAYTTVDFDLNEVAPGLIDHREWTAANGHNNALRIHGLGAPRAFHVPTLRQLGFPNVSYGEDYAVALRLGRTHRVGRLYESLYWCRRWEGNSDRALPLEVQNRYHRYKDWLRTVEMVGRLRAGGDLE